ncbi:methyltransferase domain-containing protein [uncultured Clostridium sp.]|nr:methyltransferase domain-containing protein [uncultured Clostridium sp.]
MTFVKGNAEEMPFLDNSFDVMISRLAFHHFVNPREIFA